MNQALRADFAKHRYNKKGGTQIQIIPHLAARGSTEEEYEQMIRIVFGVDALLCFKPPSRSATTTSLQSNTFTRGFIPNARNIRTWLCSRALAAICRGPTLKTRASTSLPKRADRVDVAREVSATLAKAGLPVSHDEQPPSSLSIE